MPRSLCEFVAVVQSYSIYSKLEGLFEVNDNRRCYRCFSDRCYRCFSGIWCHLQTANIRVVENEVVTGKSSITIEAALACAGLIYSTVTQLIHYRGIGRKEERELQRLIKLTLSCEYHQTSWGVRLRETSTTIFSFSKHSLRWLLCTHSHHRSLTRSICSHVHHYMYLPVVKELDTTLNKDKESHKKIRLQIRCLLWKICVSVRTILGPWPHQPLVEMFANCLSI